MPWAEDEVHGILARAVRRGLQRRRGAVPPGCEPYHAGAVWAEPDLDHAAEQIVRVYSASETREAIAANGQSLVRRTLDPAAVGERMAARLHILRGFVE